MRSRSLDPLRVAAVERLQLWPTLASRGAALAFAEVVQPTGARVVRADELGLAAGAGRDVRSGMFRGRTVFIVGAGASHELGLPLGSDLKARISNILAIDSLNGRMFGDRAIHLAAVERANEIAPGEESRQAFGRLIQAGKNVARAMQYAPSIDNFIEAHRDDPDIGFIAKLAISATILNAEFESAVARTSGRSANDKHISQSYLPAFTEQLFTGIGRANIGDLFNNITIICFNYDRCIETYLRRAVSEYYQVNQAAVNDIMKTLSITHPYGQVGELPAYDGDGGIPFGARNADLGIVAKGLLTFSETIESLRKAKINAAVRTAETIVFLGFGFLQQNLKLLQPDRPSTAQIYATRGDISVSDAEQITADLSNITLAWQSSEMSSRWCAELLANHRMALRG